MVKTISIFKWFLLKTTTTTTHTQTRTHTPFSWWKILKNVLGKKVRDWYRLYMKNQQPPPPKRLPPPTPKPNQQTKNPKEVSICCLASVSRCLGVKVGEERECVCASAISNPTSHSQKGFFQKTCHILQVYWHTRGVTIVCIDLKGGIKNKTNKKQNKKHTTKHDMKQKEEKKTDKQTCLAYTVCSFNSLSLWDKTTLTVANETHINMHYCDAVSVIQQILGSSKYLNTH